VGSERRTPYVSLIYQGTTPLPNSPERAALSADEQKRIYDESAADYAAITKTPGVTPGLPLGLPEKAATVRVKDGETFTSDGPFVDTKGAVGGYIVFEADNRDAAIELASRIPAARFGGAIEVRPAETYW
jgi:hypothetical protein